MKPSCGDWGLHFGAIRYSPPLLQNKPLVKKVVLLAAHGLDSALWESPAGQAALPTWRRCLGEPIELQARNATLAPGARAEKTVGFA